MTEPTTRIMDPVKFLDLCYAKLQQNFLKQLESGSMFSMQGSLRETFNAQRLLNEALTLLDKEKILAEVVSKLETTIAERVAAEIVNHVMGDVKRVMSDQKTRVDVANAVRQVLFARKEA